MAIVENDYAAYLKTSDGEIPLRDLDAQKKISSLSEDLVQVENALTLVKSKNLYDKFSSIDGYYVSPTSGNLASNEEWSYYYIKLEENERSIAINIPNVVIYAFMDKNETFISGSAQSYDKIVTIPSNASVLRFSVAIKFKSTIQVEYGEEVTEYEEFFEPYYECQDKELRDYYNKAKAIDYYINTNGTGDFATLKECIDYIETNYRDYETLSLSRDIIVHLEDGVYNIFDMWIPSNTCRGLEMYSGLTIKGETEEGTILYGSVGVDEYSYDVKINASPVNFKSGGTLENLTVKAKNVRYGIHPDFGNTTDYTRHLKNVHVIYEGFEVGSDEQTWVGGAIGSGVHSGETFIIENCILDGGNSNPFGCHSNVNFTKPATVKVINTKLISKGKNWIAIRSLESGVMNELEFIGCQIGCPIAMNPTADEVYDWNIKGYGNSIIPQIDNVSSNTFCKFTDEVVFMVNNTDSILEKGTLVMRDFNEINSCKPLDDDSKEKFYGIALEQINAGEVGAIRINGYYQFKQNCSAYSKIGIVNNKLAEVESGEIVGIVDYISKTQYGFIRLLK